MNITSSTKLNEVYGSPSFSKVKDLLVSGTDFFAQNGELTFAELQGLHPTWYSEDLVFGLSRLQELASSRNKVAYPVYSSADATQSARIANVNLLFFPAERKTCDTYVILLAGGAYEAVCTMIEALPVAAKLNELGVTCFCLNYRTFSDESFVNGLLPEPLDDLAAGWRFIEQNQEIFGVSANDYIVGGFSAGGHVAS
ncbi:MAG: alpha/beta hydrolase, partial [Clostridiales bacterium]|nr:alpha/beta hydrolase [Clostridiales bacterium]